MAWKKIPKEHHPIFHAAIPVDPRVTTIRMFGGVCTTVGGHMFAGLWADTVVVRLSEVDRKKVLAMKDGESFDPMGRGKPMKEMVLLPPAVLKQKARLRNWIQKALDYTSTLPPKKKKPRKAKKAAKRRKTTGKKR